MFDWDVQLPEKRGSSTMKDKQQSTASQKSGEGETNTGKT
jgi:hypothetical protein